MIKWICIISIVFSLKSLAFEPLRDPSLLWEAKPENVVRVTTGKVVIADYELIRRDFPETRNWSTEAIDQWLVRNTSFVSKEQAAQTEVNTPIEISSEEREAYRPREYRRAHVFAVDTGGLIDAKGTGAADPQGGSHDNGLATLGDMIREFAFEKLIHALFVKDGRFDTVGSYAVIDFGFSIKHPKGGTSRAGVILRQAHVRHHSEPIGNRTRGQSVMLPRSLQVSIEKFLRRFGITSSVKFGGIDFVNLQGAENGAVIDFGSFLVEERFTREVSFFYNKKGEVSSGEEKIMSPGERDFVQPERDLQMPFETWGYSEKGISDPKYDNPYIWSHRLAEDLASGKAGRGDAEQHLRNLFDKPRVQNIFRSIPRFRPRRASVR